MRIITGSARGTRLLSPEGEATRPTADRTKEAVFSVLQFSLEGRRVLDLFAGSGQLALEALSRGAAAAVAVDSSKDAAAIIQKNADKTHLSEKLRVECGEVRDRLYRMRQDPFDVIFIDPPYALGLVPETLSLLLRCGRVKPTSVIVCETANEDDVFMGDAALAEKFTVARAARYGAAFVTFLRPKEA